MNVFDAEITMAEKEKISNNFRSEKEITKIDIYALSNTISVPVINFVKIIRFDLKCISL